MGTVDIIEALRTIGIQATETIKNRVVVLHNVEAVPAADARLLGPKAIEINKCLQDHGLLDKPWRCQRGGTTTHRWLIILNQNPEKRR